MSKDAASTPPRLYARRSLSPSLAVTGAPMFTPGGAVFVVRRVVLAPSLKTGVWRPRGSRTGWAETASAVWPVSAPTR